MIFNVPGHIQCIRNGLRQHPPISFVPPRFIIKTESRRLSRGIYQIEAERTKPHKVGYAVQLKRGVKAESDIRIVMDRIWEEERSLTHLGLRMLINHQDAWAEGGYTPEEYEKVFRDINPKWDGQKRWAFKFHAIKVQT